MRRPLPLRHVYHYTAWSARDTRQRRTARLHAHTARCRCTRIDGRKAFCSALLTSCPPLIPDDVFYAPPSAAARSDAEDAPRFPESNTVRVSSGGTMHLLALLRLFFYALKMGGRFTRPAPLSSLLYLLTLPCRLWVHTQQHCPNYSNSLCRTATRTSE
jgi:hypothetical protein